MSEGAAVLAGLAGLAVLRLVIRRVLAVLGLVIRRRSLGMAGGAWHYARNIRVVNTGKKLAGSWVRRHCSLVGRLFTCNWVVNVCY